MKEFDFFKSYTNNSQSRENTELVESFKKELDKVRSSITELGFSNIWIAQQTAPLLPANSKIHLGIYNSLRSWNFFDLPAGVESFCNVGGFGIDGTMSALIGASLVNPHRLYFGVFGDLAFFYDMNVLGNRHVGKNVRIMLINNGRGTEFRLYNHPCYAFGEEADDYMAAAGHFGNKSPMLVRHYAENLGYEYLYAASKEEYIKVRSRFLCKEITEKPMLLEIFTDSSTESDMLFKCNHALSDTMTVLKKSVVGAVKGVVGEQGVETIKKILGK